MANKVTQWKEGESGNPKGRPKGSLNRTTAETRKFIQDIVNKKLDNLETDLVKMSPTNQWIILEKLTKYFLPALSKNDNTNDVSGEIKIKVVYEDESTPNENDGGVGEEPEEPSDDDKNTLPF